MTDAFSRTDRSILGNWWWTIDKPLFFSFITLLALGILLSFAGSPGTAERLNIHSFYFAIRHAILTVPALFILFVSSLAAPRLLRHLCWLALALCFIFLVLTPLFGTEIKGARRWISLGGFSLQVTEFVKPCFIMVAAWLFSETKPLPLKGSLISFILYCCLVFLILLQPDFGMTFIISAIWFIQLFLSGFPLLWTALICGVGVVGGVGAYFFFPHVTSRIDRFLNPALGDQYQITKSLEAFKSGGVFGQGPGEGIFKRQLPDAHADFIFPVAAEEFGFFFCLFVVGLYAFIFLRCFFLSRREHNLFLILALVGLASQFTLQAFINMASSLQLIPTKGMTLPFLSYGGSSLLGVALGAGMILSITRKRSDDSKVF